MPTKAEDTQTNHGIAADLDNPEWTAADFAAARPAADVMPADMIPAPRRRGPAATPAKVVVTLRVPPAVLEEMTTWGPKWRTRAAEALAAYAAQAKGGRRKAKGG